MPLAGEIRLFAGNVAPDGWAFCHGQVASITSAPALHAAIGSRFGGDGQTTFALPDLRGRVPVHRSTSIPLGAEGGSEVVALNDDEIPDHLHTVPVGRRAAGGNQPGRLTLAGSDAAGEDAAAGPIALGVTTWTGVGNTHANMQPFLCLNFIVALDDGPDDGPIVGEVRLFAGERRPAGWKACDGQSLELGKYGGLYSVLGTTYGGDGRSSFALPDLRGRVAIQAGYRPGLSARRLGEAGGEVTVDLDDGQLPAHSHEFKAVVAGVASRSNGSVPVVVRSDARIDDDADRPPVSITTSAVGENAHHPNLQPYLALTYLIACNGRLP